MKKGRHKAQRRLEKDLGRYEAAKKGNLRKSDYVTITKVPWVSVDVTLTLQEQLIPLSEQDKMRMIRERMGLKCGFFKLESDRDMTPQEALRRYRRRAGVEHLISSLKRITGIKPIRVWSKDSINGSMVLALFSEAAIAMARSCLAGEALTMTDEDGNEYTHLRKPSTESLVAALTHLTLTSFREGKGPYRAVTSNWNPISREIMAHIILHESPDWGSRKVQRVTVRS